MAPDPNKALGVPSSWRGNVRTKRARIRYRRWCRCELCRHDRRKFFRDRERSAALSQYEQTHVDPYQDEGCHAFCGPCMCGDYDCYDHQIEYFYEWQDAQEEHANDA